MQDRLPTPLPLEGGAVNAPTMRSVLERSPVMPVVTLHDAASAPALARALAAGGVRVIEITLRTPAALEAISTIREEVPEVCVGAGTVLRERDLERAVQAGAQFAISPGFTPALLEAGRDAPIPYLPAVATPAEIMQGLEAGYTAFKLFPAAQAGGPAFLKLMQGPFPTAVFCPTGGVDLASMADYRALSNVACVGGSWLAPTAAIEAADWSAITRLAREAVTADRLRPVPTSPSSTRPQRPLKVARS